jgi:hypothetical protein
VHPARLLHRLAYVGGDYGRGRSTVYTLTTDAVDPGLVAPSNSKINGTQYAVAFDGRSYVLPSGFD